MPQYRFFVLFLVFAALLSAAGAVSAQQFRNTISGSVFDSRRQPVGDVPVELLNEVYSVLQRVRTNGSGRYFFNGLSAGRFMVRVLPLGTNLEEQTQEVEIVNFVRPNSGGATSFGVSNEQKDFYLRLRKDFRDQPANNAVVFAQEVPPGAKTAYESGLTDLTNKNTESAIKNFDNAISLFPEYFAALERLGRVHLETKNFAKAAELFSRATKINDRSLSSWYGYGFASYALGKSSDAVAAGKKLIELSQNSFENHLLLGVALRSAKQYSESEKSLQTADKLAKGKSADVYWNLALLYAYNLKRYAEAAQALESYLELTPQNPSSDNIKKLIAEYRVKK